MKKRPQVKQAEPRPGVIVETHDGRVIATRLRAPMEREQTICLEFHSLLSPSHENSLYQASLDFHLLTDAEASAVVEAIRVVLEARS